MIYNSGTIKVTEWIAPPYIQPSPGPQPSPPLPPIPPDPPQPPPPTPPSFAFTGLTNTLVARTVAGTTTQVITADRVITRTIGTTTYQDQQMSVFYTGTPASTLTWTSSNTAVATIDQYGFLTNLTSGNTTVTVSTTAASISSPLTLSIQGGSTTDSLSTYVVGSLARHVSDAIDNRIQGKGALSAIQMYTTQNHTSAIYVRNPNFWGADLGSALCSISPWNSTGGNLMAGVAISPVHIIFAAHFQISSGATVRFVLSDGTVVARTMVSKLTDPNYAPYWPDLTVGILDSPLPDTIPIAKVLPDNWQQYLPSLSPQYTVPALCLDQEEKGIVTDLGTLGSNYAQFIYPNRVNWAKRAEFYEAKISGDSGNPAFLIINNQLIIITVWTFGGAGSGTNIIIRRAQVNQMMSQLGGDYTLQNATLTGFPTYA